MVIHADKAICIFFVCKRVVTARIANIPELNKYIDLTRLSSNAGFRNINRIWIQIIGLNTSIKAYIFNHQGVSAVRAHPVSSKYFIILC